MLMVDREGTPLSAFTLSASRAEVHVIKTLVDVRQTGRLPERLLYDKAADADWLRERLEARQVELICPNRSNRRKQATQDRRKLRRYCRRYRVERTISWLQHLRRLVVRYEYYDDLFQGFVEPGCLFTALRRF